MNTLFEWSPDKMLEIELTTSDDFLKIAETLTRIGISNNKLKTLFQSCHILHKRGKYYIVHYKELFALDNRLHTLTDDDIERRNMIAHLLQQWKMCTIVDKSMTIRSEDIQKLHVIKFSEKSNWTLKPKYRLGINK